MDSKHRTSTSRRMGQGDFGFAHKTVTPERLDRWVSRRLALPVTAGIAQSGKFSPMMAI